MDSINRAEIRSRFLKVETANVSDVMDEMGITDQALSTDFAPRSGHQLAGWAYTIQGTTRAGGRPTDPLKVQACSGVGPDEVTVWSGDGQGACYLGELIALGLQGRGCVGALIDGGIRDITWLAAIGFPTFSTYRSPVQSIGRWQVESWGEPLRLPGATAGEVVVHPGDFILADADGAIVVPADHVLNILQLSEVVTRREIEIRKGLQAGMNLSEAIERFGAI